MIRNSTITNIAVGTVVCVACTSTLAQVTVQSSWLFSTDNGTSWLPGLISVPDSQPSVLIRMQVTVFENGTQVPFGGRWRFTDAMFEAYSTTSTSNGDTASSILQHSVALLPETSLSGGNNAARRVGNVLAIDRRDDTTPLGTFPGVFVTNRGSGFNGPLDANPLALLQFRLALDGSLGDRNFSSAFLPFTATGGATAGIGQVLVRDTQQSTFTVQPVTVTQIPATLTVIPTPTTLALFTITSLFTTRRRR
ncbi:hypothetical protein LBMAG48_26150 [Phycisphaerae bacterium]|nr:hypothetical protein LBMAG48_26150 [Phycisphaerae bacterium]